MKRAAVLFVLFLWAGTAQTVLGRPLSDYQQADALFSSRHYEKALPLYQSALAAPPAGVPAGDIHAKIGDTQFRLNRYDGALSAYREAIKDLRASDRPKIQYWIGFCCFLTGRDAEAVTELLKVPALYPEAAAWGATAYYWAGRASERMGRRDLASEYYRKAAGGSSRTTQGKFARKKAEAVKGK